MFGWILTAAYAAVLATQSGGQTRTADDAVDTQPATRPSAANTVLRRPAQAEILRNLLGRTERPSPVRPQELEPADRLGKGPTAALDDEGQLLLLEGTFLVERPGRLVREDGRAKFVFLVEGEAAKPRSIELLPNQLLEVIEREAEAGFTEFIISGEVTRYRGANYLLLRKVLRRVSHGNLAP